MKRQAAPDVLPPRMNLLNKDMLNISTSMHSWKILFINNNNNIQVPNSLRSPSCATNLELVGTQKRNQTFLGQSWGQDSLEGIKGVITS